MIPSACQIHRGYRSRSLAQKHILLLIQAHEQYDESETEKGNVPILFSFWVLQRRLSIDHGKVLQILFVRTHEVL